MICERHWGSFVQYRLSPLACYSPADYADHAERMQQAALFRRERQVGMVKAVVVVLGFVCDYLRDLRETLGFPLCGLIEYSCVLFSRR